MPELNSNDSRSHTRHIGTGTTMTLSGFPESDDSLAMVARVIPVNEPGMGIEFLRQVD